MKKLFCLFVALLATTTLWAHDFEVDGIYYLILTSETNEVQVTFRGESYDSYNDEYIDSVIIPETVSYNGTTYSVTSIGWAFMDCRSLASVTIPNSVTSIQWWAFRNCSSLVSITIPNSVTSIGHSAFSGCSSLTSITIPDSVTSIEMSAFEGCSSLTSVNIPDGVMSIGKFAFSGCSSLTSINIPNSVTSIGDAAFWGCSSLTSINIPNSVTSIGENAFYNCSSLTSITIPNGVTSIGVYAFLGCSSLTSVVWNVKNYADFSEPSKNPLYSIRSQITSFTFGDSVEYAPAYLCYGMDKLTSIVWNSKSCADFSNSVSVPLYDIRTQITSFTFGESVEDIPAYLCFDMSNLTSIIIPNSVTSIGNDAFFNCSSLTSITTPDSVTSIGTYAFANCSSLTSFNIPNGLTSIEGYAFNACSSLTSINIPDGVKTIGKSAFSVCSSLTSITIPNSVTSIGERAFYNCSSLTSITIPNGVTSIGDEAFAGRTKLYDIYCYAMAPPTAYKSSFVNYNAFVHVPCDALRYYQADVTWGEFKHLQCIDSEDVTTVGITVTPSTNDVTITWSTEDGADTYSIVITKDGEVFCTLTFNSNGQLVSIAFAPGREGNHPAQYAEAAANGYRFTVTGLKEGTKYGYNLDVKDSTDKTIKSYEGEFTTLGGNETSVEDVIQNATNTQKLLRNGQLIILRDGVEYNAMGQEL